MDQPARDVLITGSGWCPRSARAWETHLSRLAPHGSFQPAIESVEPTGHFVHPLPPIDWSLQIPKKGDQRQMETWQKLGVYAAGLALADAESRPTRRRARRWT